MAISHPLRWSPPQLFRDGWWLYSVTGPWFSALLGTRDTGSWLHADLAFAICVSNKKCLNLYGFIVFLPTGQIYRSMTTTQQLHLCDDNFLVFDITTCWKNRFGQGEEIKSRVGKLHLRCL